jgi:hypothetical protein
MIVFWNITSLIPFVRTIVDPETEIIDSDVAITDTFFVNLMKTKLTPYDSGGRVETAPPLGPLGDTVGGDEYLYSITDSSARRIGTKPCVLTIENNKIVLYTLNQEIVPLIEAGHDIGILPGPITYHIASSITIVNPDITNNGDNKMLRATSDLLTEQNAGEEWTVTHSGASVIYKTGQTPSEFSVSPLLLEKDDSG